MCTPVLGFIVSALQAVASFAAAADEKARNDENARKAFEQDQLTLSQRQMQEQDAAAEEKYKQQLEGARAQANIEVSASAAGVGGANISNLTDEVSRRMGRNTVVFERNAAMKISQLQLEKKGSQAQRQGQINAVPPPNPLSLVAGIAGAALRLKGMQ